MFTEILKLDELLTKAKLPHTLNFFNFGREQTPIGYQIRLFEDETHRIEIDDCVCHTFSHGYGLGLLETYWLGNCEGYETAEQVFEGWQKMYQKALEK